MFHSLLVHQLSLALLLALLPLFEGVASLFIPPKRIWSFLTTPISTEEKGVPMSASVSCWPVYAALLWSVSLGFVPEAPVWECETRSGTSCNLVSMHTDDVASDFARILV